MSVHSCNVAAAALAILFALGSVGCGERRPTTYAVKGKVVYTDGSPVTAGVVMFLSTSVEGKEFNARGEIQPDGSYVLSTFELEDGVVAGRHRALVREVAVLVSEMANDETPGPPGIDQKFARFDTSGLEFDITADQTDLTITVTRP